MEMRDMLEKILEKEIAIKDPLGFLMSSARMVQFGYQSEQEAMERIKSDPQTLELFKNFDLENPLGMINELKKAFYREFDSSRLVRKKGGSMYALLPAKTLTKKDFMDTLSIFIASVGMMAATCYGIDLFDPLSVGSS